MRGTISEKAGKSRFSAKAKWPGKPESGKALIEINADAAASVANATSKRRALPFVGKKLDQC